MMIEEEEEEQECFSKPLGDQTALDGARDGPGTFLLVDLARVFLVETLGAFAVAPFLQTLAGFEGIHDALGTLGVVRVEEFGREELVAGSVVREFSTEASESREAVAAAAAASAEGFVALNHGLDAMVRMERGLATFEKIGGVVKHGLYVVDQAGGDLLLLDLVAPIGLPGELLVRVLNRSGGRAVMHAQNNHTLSVRVREKIHVAEYIVGARGATAVLIRFHR